MQPQDPHTQIFSEGLRLLFALLCPFVAALVQWSFWPVIQPFAWLLFYPAVFASSWVAGLRGGLTAAVLSTGLAVYFFIPPQFSFAVANRGSLISVVIFLGIGLLFSVHHERMRYLTRQAARAVRETEAANTRLESEVNERTGELRTSEARLSTIVENLVEGVVVSSMEGQLLHFNHAAMAMHGFTTREEYLRKLPDFTDTFELATTDAPILPLAQWPLARVLRGETLRDWEVHIRQIRTGWRRIFSYSGTLVRDAAGAPQMAILTIRDITERKQSETRFQALIEHSTDAIALIDASNKILYLSPGVTAVEGYSPEELLQRSGLEHAHPDDVLLIHSVMQRLLASPGKPIPVLWRRRHKNGEWLWLEGVATNLLNEPAVQAIVTNYRDVTERIRQQEKIRSQLEHLALLDHITRAIGERQDLRSIFQVCIRSLETGLPIDFGCVLLHDTADNSLQVSCIGSHGERIVEDLALGEAVRIAIDQNGLQRCIRGDLVYEDDIRQLAFPFPERLAKAGLGSVVLAPLRSESQVFGILVAARKAVQGFDSNDCEFLRQLSEHIALAAHQSRIYTALQEAYEELRQTHDIMMQEERLRALGQMASGIAHDINNALTPMMLYAETLLETETGLGTTSRGYLETIKRCVYDVAQTVSRLRDFYRPRDEQLPLAPVQLNSMAQQIVDLTRARWHDMPQQRGYVVQVRTELEHNLPKVMGIESEIREALTNLVLNAVDAMPSGGILTIRTRLVRSPGTPTAITGNNGNAANAASVAIEVIDTGIGMDGETRLRCLEPFFTTKGERGTGLGLPMVFGMAQRHDAQFDIESQPGAGTTMRLLFNTPATATGDSGLQAVAPAIRRGLRLLLIDDDPILLRSLRDALEIDKHDIVSADGGMTGVDIFLASLERKEHFAAVITDLGMPHMDGREVAARIKQASPDTPVILLTGWGQRLLAEGDVPPHVDCILAKPPKLAELRKTLIQLC